MNTIKIDHMEYHTIGPATSGKSESHGSDSVLHFTTTKKVLLALTEILPVVPQEETSSSRLEQ